MRISDWSSDVCSSDLRRLGRALEIEAAVGSLAHAVADGDIAGLAGRGRQRDADEFGGEGIERGGLAVQRDDAATLRRRHPALQRRQILHQLVGRLLGRFRQRLCLSRRLEEHTSELQSLMRISYAVFCLKK